MASQHTGLRKMPVFPGCHPTLFAGFYDGGCDEVAAYWSGMGVAGLFFCAKVNVKLQSQKDTKKSTALGEARCPDQT